MVLPRIFWSVFSASAAIRDAVEHFFLALGATSAVLGAVMALLQRHFKRLLAFSTMSHMGILLLAFSLLHHTALTGMFAYLVGHGLVKGALFIVAGILLSMLGGIDEHQLRGKGSALWPVGLLMALGALLLAGASVGADGQRFREVGNGCPGCRQKPGSPSSSWLPAR